MSVSYPDGPTDFENRIVDHFAYRYPYTTFVNPAGNIGYCADNMNWLCYNAINVGNVRHENQTHYVMMGLNTPCLRNPPIGGDPFTVARNPLSLRGHRIPFAVNCSTACAMTNYFRSDRELPHVVSPGYHAFDACGYTTNCLQLINAGAAHGTSLSAPIANGIAACILSMRNWVLKPWPEATRAVLILTAQNVYGTYWRPDVDGIDGNGVISGTDAVNFMQNALIAFQPNTVACSTAVISGTINENPNGPAYWCIPFQVKIPSVKPAGKHLRVLLTWDSSPTISQLVFSNELADLDLYIPGYPNPYTNNQNWGSWESNVEVADIASSRLTPGSTVSPNIWVWKFSVPSTAYNRASGVGFIHYSIAWGWVKDHAI